MNADIKPLAVFRLGSRKVIQCRITRGQPQEALQKSLYYRDGPLCIPIRLTGLSTAWGEDSVFDFAFEGQLEPPVEPSSAALITADEGTGVTAGTGVSEEKKVGSR